MKSSRVELGTWRGVAASRANLFQGYVKPNEDYALVDNERGIFLILDGVSRTCRPGTAYCEPSPAAEVAKLFAETAHAVLAKNAATGSPEERLRRAAGEANRAVGDYNFRHFPVVDWLENNPAGAVGILGILLSSEFHYVYLGDCSGRVIRGRSARLFTHSQTEPLRQVLQTSGLTGDARTVFCRRDVCNRPGHEYGYGVFNGDPAALSFIQSGSFKLDPSDVIVLATDGVEAYLETVEVASLWPFGPEDLILQAEGFEAARPEIRSDDKTVVVIRREDSVSDC